MGFYDHRKAWNNTNPSTPEITPSNFKRYIDHDKYNAEKQRIGDYDGDLMQSIINNPNDYAHLRTQSYASHMASLAENSKKSTSFNYDDDCSPRRRSRSALHSLFSGDRAYQGNCFCYTDSIGNGKCASCVRERRAAEVALKSTLTDDYTDPNTVSFVNYLLSAYGIRYAWSVLNEMEFDVTWEWITIEFDNPETPLIGKLITELLNQYEVNRVYSELAEMGLHETLDYFTEEYIDI
jgi:hypothetical protein